MFAKTALAVITILLISVVLVGGVKSADRPAEQLAEESFDPALAAQADAARWVAMGEFYARLEAERERAIEADAARWVAKGEYYAKLAEAERERAIAAETARWMAMGEYYARLEARRERAIEADAARWVAKGEYYAELAEAERE